MALALCLAVLFALFLVCLHPEGRVQVARTRRVLWVCRISALSAGLGLVLFYAAPPARDLLAETGGGLGYWLAFFALVLAWALITHYAARKALEQEAWATPPGDDEPYLPGQYALAAAWVPRVLGLLCLASVGVGIHGAAKTIESMGSSEELEVVRAQLRHLYWGLGATALVFVVIIVFRNYPYRDRRFGLREYFRTFVLGDPAAVAFEGSPFWFIQLTQQRYRIQRIGLKGDFAAVALVGATLICLVVAFFFPLTLGAAVPRALFIPLMLGLPIFAFSFLSALSHYLRFPLLLLLIFILGGAAVLAPTFNDARLLDRPAGATRQVELGEALQAYRENCRKTNQGPGCERNPIIVATAGGASRAAFLTATVIGDLLDQGRGGMNVGANIFALSGVSGGAVGAAIVRAALAETNDGKPPCRSTDALWFGERSSSIFRRRDADDLTWRQCLQTFAAGDFLSPAVIGLTLRDGWGGTLGVLRWPWHLDDRGTLLEQAFEQRFDLIRKPSDRSVFGVAMMATSEQTGLHRALGDRSSAADGWVPLLLLNATSVATGRRVIASEVSPHFVPRGTAPASQIATPVSETGTPPAQRLFPEAYDLFELLDRSEAGATGSGRPADIRLSTAASLSARFPVISPHAGLRFPTDGELVDRVVDGGYFENDGVTTAFELARALRQVAEDVRPVILHITNEPVAPDTSVPVSPATTQVATPRPRAPEWFEAALNPIRALFGTRTGHAAEAIRRTVDAGPGGVRSLGIHYVTFQVFNSAPERPAGDRNACRLGTAQPLASDDTKIDELAMSWWLSGPVQDYLDRQLCHPRNEAQYRELEDILRAPDERRP